MDMVLWRHAKAQEWTPGCDDMARALTPKGEKQATCMASWLDRQLPEVTRIWVSPARRTEETARALGRKYKICAELAPQAQLPELLECLQWPRAKTTTLLVGHQPMLGQLIAELMAWKVSDCSVKKGAVWWLRSRSRDAADQAVIVTVQSPDFL